MTIMNFKQLKPYFSNIQVILRLGRSRVPSFRRVTDAELNMNHLNFSYHICNAYFSDGDVHLTFYLQQIHPNDNLCGLHFLILTYEHSTT